MEMTIMFVGLDVHKESLSVADGGMGGAVRFVGTVPNTAGALTKLADRLAGKGGVLGFCYGRSIRPAVPAAMGFTATCGGWAMTAWWWRRRRSPGVRAAG